MRYHEREDLYVLKIDDVVQLTGYKEGTIYNLTSKGEIPHKHLGRLLRFSLQEIIAWMSEGGPKGSRRI